MDRTFVTVLCSGHLWRVVEQLKKNYKCLGGGRMQLDSDAKTIKIYGYSQVWMRALAVCPLVLTGVRQNRSQQVDTLGCRRQSWMRAGNFLCWVSELPDFSFIRIFALYSLETEHNLIDNEKNLENNWKRLSLDQKIKIVRYYYRNGKNVVRRAGALSLVFGDTFQGCLL
jgi:hypothetical protein